MIPIAKPYLGEEEAAAAREVILSGWVTQGPKGKEFEDNFASYVGANHACAVSSCTTALHLALLAVGVRPGDVVITVSHSFIATANAIRYCGAEPVFVDIEPKSFNMNPDALAACLNECRQEDEALYYQDIGRIAVGESPLVPLGNSPNRLGRVAAVLVVHQMGMPCDLNTIIPLCKTYNLPVVEDAACAIGSEINYGDTWQKIGKPHGDIACFSFHPRKVLTTGDGGMMTTNTAEYDQKFRLLRQHGMSVSDAVRHSSNKVIIEDYLTTGFNYRMTDIQAAVGIEQLKKLLIILEARREQATRYMDLFKDVEGLVAPVDHLWTATNWQSYPLTFSSEIDIEIEDVMQRLFVDGITVRPGIMNIHQTEAYRQTNWCLPESENVRNNCILLPIFCGLTSDQQECVCSSIKTILL